MNNVTIKMFAAVAVMLVLSACEDGPSGVHPSTELDQVRRRGAPFNDSYTVRLAGHGILSGDSIAMKSFLYDTGHVAFQSFLPATIITLENSSVDRVQLTTAGKLTAPTTINTWAVGPISIAGNGVSATMESGPYINHEGRSYFGINGTVVITHVAKDEAFVYGVEGYLNGTFQSIWPKGFVPTSQKPVPDGFSVQSPTLVGDKLTVHSLRFRTTMANGVRYVQ